MKTKKLTTLLCAASSAMGLALVSCEVEKTQEGNLPDVNVEGETQLPKYEVTKTQEGNLPEVTTEGEVQLPKYNVEGPDVEVGSKTIEVEVPTVDVETPEEQRNEGDNTEE